MKKFAVIFVILAVVCFAFAAMAGQMMTGTVTGTNAALNVSIGFTPDSVKVTNITNATTRVCWWNKSMSAGKTGFINGTGGPKMTTSTGAITTYAGSATAARGFTIGAATGTGGNQTNTSGDTLVWEAYQ